MTDKVEAKPVKAPKTKPKPAPKEELKPEPKEVRRSVDFSDCKSMAEILAKAGKPSSRDKQSEAALVTAMSRFLK